MKQRMIALRQLLPLFVLDSSPADGLSQAAIIPTYDEQCRHSNTRIFLVQLLPSLDDLEHLELQSTWICCGCGE